MNECPICRKSMSGPLGRAPHILACGLPLKAKDGDYMAALACKRDATFADIREVIREMDTCGFFTGNGAFGLEKRDRLLALVNAVESQQK